MTCHRTITVSPARAWMKRASAGLLCLGSACQSAPTPPRLAEPTPSVSAPLRGLVVEAAAPFSPSVVRLTPDSAARLATLGRDSMAVQLWPGLELSLWAPEQ